MVELVPKFVIALAPVRVTAPPVPASVAVFAVTTPEREIEAPLISTSPVVVIVPAIVEFVSPVEVIFKFADTVLRGALILTSFADVKLTVPLF